MIRINKVKKSLKSGNPIEIPGNELGENHHKLPRQEPSIIHTIFSFCPAFVYNDLLTAHNCSCYVHVISDFVPFVSVVLVMGTAYFIDLASVDDLPVVLSGTGFFVLLISAAACVDIVTIVDGNVEVLVLTVAEDMCVVVVAGTGSDTILGKTD